uniref:Immunoglobulin V-set domain-containing protein n=1 Tax=Xiphophorus couchianus TaxID=32473 RepID=A0A3B5LVH5_9TELE
MSLRILFAKITRSVVLAEWSRPDQTLAPVLLYRNKKVDGNQLAAYKGRTSLLAAEKGDLSLVLKKVVGRDTGKYECRVLLEGSGDEEEELEIEQPRSGGRGGRSGTFLTSASRKAHCAGPVEYRERMG